MECVSLTKVVDGKKRLGHRRSRYIAFASIAAGTLILLLPALIAGRPFVFWDTPVFYGWGHDILAAIRRPWPPLAHFPAHRGLWAAALDVPGGSDRITPTQFQLTLSAVGARSKFYAVPLYALGSTLGLWAPAVVQAVLVSWMLWITLGVVLPRRDQSATAAGAHIALLAALTIGTGAPFYATFLMPDVFAALSVLAAALLLCFSDRLTRAGQAGCAVLVVVAALVHISNFAVVVALLFIATVASRLLSPPVPAWRGARIVIAALLGAGAIGIASDAGLHMLFKQPIRTAPFLEGRLIADGPGHLFLRETCAQHPWVACRYKDLRVVYPDDIIWPFSSWHHLPLINDPAERNRYLDEEVPFVLGTVTHHPFAELRHVLSNTVRQFLNFNIADSIGASLSGMLTENANLRSWVLQNVPNLGLCRVLGESVRLQGSDAIPGAASVYRRRSQLRRPDAAAVVVVCGRGGRRDRSGEAAPGDVRAERGRRRDRECRDLRRHLRPVRAIPGARGLADTDARLDDRDARGRDQDARGAGAAIRPGGIGWRDRSLPVQGEPGCWIAALRSQRRRGDKLRRNGSPTRRC